VSLKDKWTQRRHLPGSERALKVRGPFLLLSGVDFSALESLTQRLLQRGQDLIASLRLFLPLLIIVQPKCGGNSDKDENQFRRPAGQTCAKGFSLLFHRPIFS